MAKALAATTATADLLGRSRIRRRQEQARKHYERFAECKPGETAAQTDCTPAGGGAGAARGHRKEAARSQAKAAAQIHKAVSEDFDPERPGELRYASHSLGAALAHASDRGNAGGHAGAETARLARAAADDIDRHFATVPGAGRAAKRLRAAAETAEAAAAAHGRAEEAAGGERAARRAERRKAEAPARHAWEAAEEHAAQILPGPGSAAGSIDSDYDRGAAPPSVRQAQAAAGHFAAAWGSRDPARVREAAERVRRAGALVSAEHNGRAGYEYTAAYGREMAQAAAGILKALGGTDSPRKHAERFAEGNSGITEIRNFAETPTDFSCFADEPIRPLAPREALRYFSRLVPRLGVDPDRWGERMLRHAFHLAEATEQTLLERVQKVIADTLASGEGVSAAPRSVDRILDSAGVTPRNPQYAEMVFRTNMMDSFQEGSHEQQKELAEDFPAWEGLVIKDGRERPEHRDLFDGKFYPAHVSLAEVRDKKRYNGYNCRCSSRPVYKTEWAEILSRGGGFSSFAEGSPEKFAGALAGKPCGPGQTAARSGCTPKARGKAASGTPRATTAAPRPKAGPVKPPPAPKPPKAPTPKKPAARKPAAPKPPKAPVKKPAAPKPPRGTKRTKVPDVQPPPLPERPQPPPNAQQARVIKSLHDHIARQASLSAEHKRDFQAAVTRVVGSMPPKALARLAEGVKKVHWYADMPEISKWYSSRPGKQLAEGEVIKGLYQGGSRTLHLDGWTMRKQSAEGVNEELNVHGTYAHEMTHAIDPDDKIADSPEWQAAFEAEIKPPGTKGPRLTEYATSDRYEGLAEFGRLVYGSDVPHAEIERRFPKAAAVWKAQGLWPEHASTHAEGLGDYDGPILGEAYTWGGTEEDGTRVDGWAGPEKHAEVAPVRQQRPWTCGPAFSLDVPDCRQDTSFNCGAAASQSAARYFKVGPKSEAEIADALGTTASGGTSPEQIAAAFRKWGLRVDVREGMSFPALERAVILGRLVLAPIQTGGSPATRTAEEEGHWIVVRGYDGRWVYLQDPAAGPRKVKRESFAADWHDRSAAGHHYERLGIILSGPTDLGAGQEKG